MADSGIVYKDVQASILLPNVLDNRPYLFLVRYIEKPCLRVALTFFDLCHDLGCRIFLDVRHDPA
ncbi:MAG: hypothetical protein NVS4B12_09750 [Ktedonobacteraceae bacterium]